MTVPDFQSMMRPILDVLSDGQERDSKHLRAAIADAMGVTAEDRQELLPSGSQRRFDNRVGWAAVYLERAGALRRVRRGVFQITDRGKALLAANSEPVNAATLRQFAEFQDFRKGVTSEESSAAAVSGAGNDESEPPLERMARAHVQHQNALASALLDRVRESDFTFFEHLVLKLLVAMGYGGSELDGSKHLGGSGDGGVDGMINEDVLGLDRIYVQAKRWTNTVGRPDVQAFVGALEGKGATKGVFITTSNFSSDALDYVRGLTRRVILIDGKQLAGLMVRFGTGVRVTEPFPVQEIDEEFFLDDAGF